MKKPDLRLATAINQRVRSADEWFDEPDELDRVDPALRSIEGSERSIMGHPVESSRCLRSHTVVDITDVSSCATPLLGRRVESHGSDPFSMGSGVRRYRDRRKLFAQVKADPETGTIGWPNGADLDPDVLHGAFEPASPAPTKS